MIATERPVTVRGVFVAVVAALSLSLSFGAAHPAELKVFASRAISTVLAEVGAEFEKNSGYKLNVVTGLSSDFIRRARAGEAFDVIAAPPASLNSLITDRKLVADSKTDLVRSGYGVVVRAGARKPDVSSVGALKGSLLEAESITYLPVPGVPQMIERLGLKEAIASKVIIPSSDVSSELVAKGEAQLGILAITQAYTTPGVELAGPLPPEIQVYTTFAGAIASNANSPEAARDLLRFLRGPSAIRVIMAQGMEPL